MAERKQASFPGRPDGWAPSIGDHVLYHGGRATVLNVGRYGCGHVVYWLRSEDERGSLRVGSEFQSPIWPLSPVNGEPSP